MLMRETQFYYNRTHYYYYLYWSITFIFLIIFPPNIIFTLMFLETWEDPYTWLYFSQRSYRSNVLGALIEWKFCGRSQLLSLKLWINIKQCRDFNLRVSVSAVASNGCSKKHDTERTASIGLWNVMDGVYESQLIL